MPKIVELIKSRQAARSAAAAPEQDAAPALAAMLASGAIAGGGGASSTASSPETVAMPSPESDEIAAIALAAERALVELDAAISSSLELSESSDDPASAEVRRQSCLPVLMTPRKLRMSGPYTTRSAYNYPFMPAAQLEFHTAGYPCSGQTRA